MDLLREGKIRLYDWGLNFNEWYPQEEVLEDNRGISADDLAPVSYTHLDVYKRQLISSIFVQLSTWENVMDS